MKTLEEHIQIFKENWNDFVEKVHTQMVRENWCWYDTNGLAPDQDKIKKSLTSLLCSLRGDSSCISSGGFTIRINKDNSIDCYFGHNSINYMGLEFHTYDINVTELDDFFKMLCECNDMLNIDYLRKKYNDYLKR